MRLADEIMQGAVRAQRERGELGGQGCGQRDPRVYSALITAASLTFHFPRVQKEEEEGGR